MNNKRTYTNAQIAYPEQYQAALVRRRWKRARVDTAPLSDPQVKAIQKIATLQAKRAIMRNSDKKATQDYSGEISLSTTGAVADVLTNMVRGDDSLNSFSGSKIIPDYWIFNYTIDFTPNIDETGSLSASMRFLLVQDKGPKFGGDVADYMNTGLSTLYPTMALRNWENNNNWTLLYDSGIVSVPTNTGTQGGNGPSLVKTGIINIPKKNLRQVFYGDGDSGINTEKNALRVVAWSDSNVAPNPVFAFQTEVGFTDGA